MQSNLLVTKMVRSTNLFCLALQTQIRSEGEDFRVNVGPPCLIGLNCKWHPAPCCSYTVSTSTLQAPAAACAKAGGVIHNVPLLRPEAELNRAAEAQLDMVEVRDRQQGGHQAASPQNLQERIEELEATMIKVYSGTYSGPAHLQLYFELECLPLTQHYDVRTLNWSRSCCGPLDCIG